MKQIRLSSNAQWGIIGGIVIGWALYTFVVVAALLLYVIFR